MKTESKIKIGDMVTHKNFSRLFGTVLELIEIRGRALVFWHNHNPEKKRFFVETKDLRRYKHTC